MKKKPKYSFRTVDELKAKGKLAGRSAQTPAGELAQVKVGSEETPLLWLDSSLDTEEYQLIPIFILCIFI